MVTAKCAVFSRPKRKRRKNKKKNKKKEREKKEKKKRTTRIIRPRNTLRVEFSPQLQCLLSLSLYIFTYLNTTP